MARRLRHVSRVWNDTKMSQEIPENQRTQIRIHCRLIDRSPKRTGENEGMNQMGMKQGQKCNFFGCSGTMKFVSIEWHELDRKIVEKCD